MGRRPCCSKEGLNRGAWTAHEDKILISYIKAHGEGKWRNLAQQAGLKRCGKSCRLRWLNYLRPNIKRGNISDDEEELIIKLHKLLGNRWSLIAGRLPGRTDNEIKNYWNTTIGKKLQHSNTSQLENQKQLIKSRKKEKAKVEPNPAEKTDEKQTPAMVETQVVRTEARRCTKVFMSPPLHKLADPCNRFSNGAQNPCEQLQNSLISTSLTQQEDGDSSNLLDFNISELCIEEFLDPDILQLFDENNGSHNNCEERNAYSCSTDQTMFFPETMLEELTTDELLQTNVGAEFIPVDYCLRPEEERF